jgi:hypothetical protein
MLSSCVEQCGRFAGLLVLRPAGKEDALDEISQFHSVHSVRSIKIRAIGKFYVDWRRRQERAP